MRRIVAALFMVSALVAAAHDISPAPGCRAPERPPDQDDVERWNGFVDAVDAYRACINEFIASNHAAASHHRSAANAATETWNTFVRSSLNVPQDYPWPPPEAAP
ncbi:MAG: hypothetical protein HC809_05455 [Gammaproteobacteria bacterium]|nr:hypothetical protein [Gammaproteobacteria bacterium]